MDSNPDVLGPRLTQPVPCCLGKTNKKILLKIVEKLFFYNFFLTFNCGFSLYSIKQKQKKVCGFHNIIRAFSKFYKNKTFKYKFLKF